MNEENRKIEEENSEEKGSDTHPPIPVVHTAESEEDGPKGAKNGQSAQSLQKVPRLSRIKQWMFKITAAEVGMLLLTGAIVYATFQYTKYAKRQWRTMQRQLDDGESAQAARLVVENFKTEVGQSAGQNLVQVFYSFDLKNAGQTVANQIFVGNGTGGCPDVNTVPVGGAGSLAAGTVQAHSHLTMGSWNGHDGTLDPVQSKTLISISLGWTDVFGHHHASIECFGWHQSEFVHQ